MVAHQKKFVKKMRTVFSCFAAQDSDKNPVKRTMVIVGDGGCGKTCVVTRMTSGHFTQVGYVPTVFDTHVLEVCSGETPVQLCINDTAGQEDYDRLRPFSYHNVDVVLLCFSLADPDSLVNVHEKWAPEVRYFCGNVPLILVGNKKDLRDVQSSLKSASPSSWSVSEASSSSCKMAARAGSTRSDMSLGSSAGRSEDVSGSSSTTSSLCRANVPSTKQGASFDISSNKNLGVSEFNVSEEEKSVFMSPFMECGQPVFNAHAPVKHSEGAIMAKRIGAHAYFETSALTGENIDELLSATTKAAVLGSKKSKKFKPFAETLSSWRSVDYLPDK